MEKSSDPYPLFRLKKGASSKRGCSYGVHDDHISSLPVELLLIILSLLPLKEMVRTSILSRRWLKLWVNTPVLDFKIGVGVFNRLDYVNWVNHVLRQHKGRYLKQFTIRFKLMNDWRKHIDYWLAFALVRKVENLALDFLDACDSGGKTTNYVFPDSWFISTGEAQMVGGKRRRVRQFNLKFLKSLSLKYVNVTSETIDFLLRNCPFLEQLELVTSKSLGDLVISDPTLVLKHLKVKRCRGLKVLSISNINLVSLNISATSIEVLILQDLPLLVRLSIWGYVYDFRSLVSQSATCLRQLKSLELCVLVIEDFTKMLSILPQLTKLKRLVIRYRAICDQSLIVLLNVIKSCTNLEEFMLKLKWTGPKRSPWVQQKVERLTFESLKLFVFRGYYGRASDYKLLKHVVKNAPGLEKIMIDPSNVVFRSTHLPEDSMEREARRIALKHINHLKETKRISPHIDVVVAEPCRGQNWKLDGLR